MTQEADGMWLIHSKVKYAQEIVKFKMTFILSQGTLTMSSAQCFSMVSMSAK